MSIPTKLSAVYSRPRSSIEKAKAVNYCIATRACRLLALRAWRVAIIVLTMTDGAPPAAVSVCSSCPLRLDICASHSSSVRSARCSTDVRFRCLTARWSSRSGSLIFLFGVLCVAVTGYTYKHGASRLLIHVDLTRPVIFILTAHFRSAARVVCRDTSPL